MNHIWQENWQQRLFQRVYDLGYSTLGELLSTMTAQPYKTVIQYLGIPAAPAQIIALQYAEAKGMGTIREAVVDSLCRNIVEACPEGWNRGKNPEWQRVKAISSWISEILVTGGLPELESKLHAVADVLCAFDIPDEWKPCGTHDPLIVQAFQTVWPTSSAP